MADKESLNNLINNGAALFWGGGLYIFFSSMFKLFFLPGDGAKDLVFLLLGYFAFFPLAGFYLTATGFRSNPSKGKGGAYGISFIWFFIFVLTINILNFTWGRSNFNIIIDDIIWFFHLIITINIMKVSAKILEAEKPPVLTHEEKEAQLIELRRKEEEEKARQIAEKAAQDAEREKARQIAERAAQDAEIERKEEKARAQKIIEEQAADQKRKDEEEKALKMAELLKLINQITPDIPVSLSRIAELVELSPSQVESYLNELIGFQEDLGEYLSLEQVFIKRSAIGENLEIVMQSTSSKPFISLHECPTCQNTQSILIRNCTRCASLIPSCEICKRGFGDQDTLFSCPYCKNQFHEIHVRAYLQSKGKCPVCKEHLSEDKLESYKLM